jgi:hypothetical protein
VQEVRGSFPEFRLLAEVYWDREWDLMQEGFDYAYDKRLYDRLRAGNTPGIRAHLSAPLDYQRRLARFMENHDEPRAAAVFEPDKHRAAAVITYLVPGLRFFHDGQLEGRHTFTSMHLVRRRKEAVDAELRAFYEQLLQCLALAPLRSGSWRAFACRPAWDGNPTWDAFVAFGWERDTGAPLLAAVNFGPTRGQCYVELPWPYLRGRQVQLRDRLSPAHFDRSGNDLLDRGLYLDIPAWGYHLFELAIP